MIGLVSARISHARQRPRRNSFQYNATYVSISLDEFAPRRSGLFSIDRANLFGLRTRDYGDGGSPKRWMEQVLEKWNLPEADGEVRLVTMPRTFGYVFNPVNFWLCYDRDGQLRAVLADVNNTFGERHCYLCFRQDRRIIGQHDVLTANKVFHVSPFLEAKGNYTFRFSIEPDQVAILIDLLDEEGLLLRTSLKGTVKPLTSWGLLRTLLLNPLMPFKVMALIHYQAVRLFFKGIRHYPKPPPPADAISQ